MSASWVYQTKKYAALCSRFRDLFDCEATQCGVALGDIKSQAASHPNCRDQTRSDPAIDGSNADFISIGQTAPREYWS